MNSNNALVILMSGGLDSMVAYHYAKSLNRFSKIIALHVNIGQPYAEKEREAVKHFDFPVEILDCEFLSSKEYAYDIPTPEKQIIPGRNMTLVALAANYGTTIWMCALKGELVSFMPDKNEEFFKQATKVLSYTFGKQISIETPFKDLLKSEVIKLGLNLGISEKQILATSSCYDGKIRNCGKCGTCVKRALAMACNNIEEKYNSDPFESDYIYELISKKFLYGSSEDYPDYRKINTHNALVTIGRPGVLNTTEKFNEAESFNYLVSCYGWNPHWFKNTTKVVNGKKNELLNYVSNVPLDEIIKLSYNPDNNVQQVLGRQLETLEFTDKKAATVITKDFQELGATTRVTLGKQNLYIEGEFGKLNTKFSLYASFTSSTFCTVDYSVECTAGNPVVPEYLMDAYYRVIFYLSCKCEFLRHLVFLRRPTTSYVKNMKDGTWKLSMTVSGCPVL